MKQEIEDSLAEVLCDYIERGNPTPDESRAIGIAMSVLTGDYALEEI